MFKTTIMVNKRKKNLLHNFYFRQTAILILYFFNFNPFLLLFFSFFPTFFVLIFSYLSGTCTFVFADISGRRYFLSSFGHFWSQVGNAPPTPPPPAYAPVIQYISFLKLFVSIYLQLLSKSHIFIKWHLVCCQLGEIVYHYLWILMLI